MCLGQLARSHGANVVLSGNATEHMSPLKIQNTNQTQLLHLEKHPQAESHKGMRKGLW